MNRLPSGSRVHRASLCASSAALPVIESISTPAEAGTAKHTFMRVSLTEGREAALVEVPEEYREACEAIEVSTFEGLQGLQSEVALAYDVVTEKTRFLGVNIERRYGELGMNELPMSLDLAGVVPGVEVVVGDLKTGRTIIPPAAKNWQMRLGALAWARFNGLEQARVGLLHAPEGSKPWWDVAPFDGWDLADFAEQLRRIVDRVRLAQINLATGKPLEQVLGEHCLYCPARQACPAQTALIRRLANEPDKVGVELKALPAAAAWAQLKVVKQMMGDVEGSLRGLAKHQPIDLGDGRVLGELTKPVDELDAAVARPVLVKLFGQVIADAACDFEASKASIQRALKPLAEERKKAWKKGDGDKPSLAALEREALGALRDAGAIKKVPKTTLCEHEAEAPALPEPRPEDLNAA